MIVVEVRGDCCWGERWLLLRWEVIVVEVRGDCCWGERWLLLRWEMIVCFVDIGGIVYRHCFNFFHNYNEIQIYHPSFRLWEVSLIIMKSRYIIHRSDYEKYHSCIRERTAFRADFSIHLLITRFICGKRIFFGHLIQYYL